MTDNKPEFPSEQQLADMQDDFNDGVRCGAYLTPDEELELLERSQERTVREARSTPETRVTVAGKRFKAECRLAGGRWVSAGTHSVESSAWTAARLKLGQMQAATNPAKTA